MSRGNLNQNIYDLEYRLREIEHKLSNRNISAREYNKLVRERERAIVQLAINLGRHGSY